MEQETKFIGYAYKKGEEKKTITQDKKTSIKMLNNLLV